MSIKSWIMGLVFMHGSVLQAADLTIKLSGWENEEGQVFIGVYDQEDGFLDSKKAIKSLALQKNLWVKSGIGNSPTV